jgi:uncharacterized PurR-regulated membrane protein YhhQ (DUF165 family)
LTLAYTIFNQWAFKTLYEVIFTPLTYGVVNFLKRKEEIDVFDYETRFNPFLMRG